jgi:signal transduction histidine kinase/CheY-like chemotaxis protein
MFFFLYDFFVRNEFRAKTNLLAAKRQFVRFVSHEVRTPLNSVCMGLTLLQEEIAMSLGYSTVEDFAAASQDEVLSRSQIAGKDQEWLNLAHEVQVNAQSSVDVLNDLLNYDKIESGTLMLELSVIPIWNLIEQTVNEFKLPAATKKINLSLKLPKDENTPFAIAKKLNQQKVVGDSVRITQILRNLVSNALKFTPENGSVNICAVYEPWKDGDNRTFELQNRQEVTAPCSGKLIVNVKDTGAGMSKEQLKKLFGQGVQFNVNQLQAGNGSGLGLFIAKGIAEQHDGSLTCDSEGLGFGTTFTMTIPLYHIEDEEDDPELQAEKAKHIAEHEMPKLRILVVDDATTNRKLLVRLLQNRGHKCEQAEDGNYAVDIVKETENTEKCFDMVLMDYEMPIMNGPEAAKEIRELGSDIFIVGITGNMMEEDVAYFKTCGANAVLPKPIKMTALEDLCMEQDVDNRNTPFLGDKSHRSHGSSIQLWAEDDHPLDISGRSLGEA